MGGLFGKSSSEREREEAERRRKKRQEDISAKDRAMLDLKVARDNLLKSQKQIEKQRAQWHEKAKAAAAAGVPKARIKNFLKMRKLFEGRLERTDKMLSDLQVQVERNEWADTQATFLKGLHEGAEALRMINEEMPLERVEAIMDDVEDAEAQFDEISSMVYGSGDQVKFTEDDEAAVDAEYAEIEAMLATEAKIAMPDVPEAAPPVATGTGAAEAKGEPAAAAAAAAAESDDEKEAVLA